MLIGNSPSEYFFIRIAVPAFRIIAPVATIASLVLSALPELPPRRPWLQGIKFWLLGEALFFWVVYVPLGHNLQKPTQHPPAPSKEEREILVRKVVEHLPNPNTYLSRWFLDAPPEEIKRENVKEFFAWCFTNTRYEGISAEEEAELDGYVMRLESRLHQSFEPGRGKARSLRTTLDPVPMQHRPLLWYFIVSIVEIGTNLRLTYGGYHYYKPAGLGTLITFPLRSNLFSWQTSASSRIGYWYRRHTSQTSAPIVFIHGIGIGFYTYVEFLLALAASAGGVDDSDGIGVVAVELTSISSRLCTPAASAMQVKEEIRKILKQRGWDDFVLVGHSYGTAVASTMLQDATFAKRIKVAMLLDPICFMLHLPDVAYNFTRRLPKAANERMLHYFASQDIMISHTLARRFFWNQLILFKEDLPESMPLTVTLSGKDLIVPTAAVWHHLTGVAPPSSPSDDSETLDDHTVWEGENLRVHWFAKLDHAGMFAEKGVRRGIAEEAREYCKQSR